MQDEIVIKIEKHTGDIFKSGQPETWYSYTIERDTEDCIGYGLMFADEASAEQTARNELKQMVRL